MFLSIQKKYCNFYVNNKVRNINSYITDCIKGATKSYRKIIFVSATKIGENTTNILNCYFSS